MVDGIFLIDNMKYIPGRYLLLAGIILAAVDILIPYLILKKIVEYWANYIFWLILALIVILIGYYKVQKWGEKK